MPSVINQDIIVSIIGKRAKRARRYLVMSSESLDISDLCRIVTNLIQKSTV